MHSQQVCIVHQSLLNLAIISKCVHLHCKQANGTEDGLTKGLRYSKEVLTRELVTELA